MGGTRRIKGPKQVDLLACWEELILKNVTCNRNTVTLTVANERNDDIIITNGVLCDCLLIACVTALCREGWGFL